MLAYTQDRKGNKYIWFSPQEYVCQPVGGRWIMTGNMVLLTSLDGNILPVRNQDFMITENQFIFYRFSHDTVSVISSTVIHQFGKYTLDERINKYTGSSCPEPPFTQRLRDQYITFFNEKAADKIMKMEEARKGKIFCYPLTVGEVFSD